MAVVVRGTTLTAGAQSGGVNYPSMTGDWFDYDAQEHHGAGGSWRLSRRRSPGMYDSARPAYGLHQPRLRGSFDNLRLT